MNETTHDAAIKALERYALDHYEQGGHWVYETHDEADYLEYLTNAQGNLNDAKAAMKRYWTLTETVANDIRNA